MARIAGVDLPRDKRIEYALPYIYGIGLTLSREILAKTGINPQTKEKVEIAACKKPVLKFGRSFKDLFNA